MHNVRIGELAEAVGLTAKTIRYYESIGIITSPPRTPSGYRSYDDSYVSDLTFVKNAQAAGLSLAQISELLHAVRHNKTDEHDVRALISSHIDDIDEQMIRLQATRLHLHQLVSA